MPTMEPVTTRRAGTRVRYQSRELTEIQKRRRFIVGLVVFLLLGALLVVVGAGFINGAKNYAHENSLIVPLIMCGLSIAIGALVLLGSIIVARLMFSRDWRYKDDVTSQRRHTAAGFSTGRAPSMIPPRPSAGLELPPPYDNSTSYSVQPGVFHIAAYNNPGLDMSDPEPPAYIEYPPSYSEIAHNDD